MVLTKHAEYAIRLLMYLAQRPGRKVAIATIAEHYDISRNHLMKVSQNLARQGYIIGYRGKGGGIALARPARGIDVGKLLQDVEPNCGPAVARETTDGAFGRALYEAQGAFIAALSVYTLADLLNDEPRGNNGGTRGDPDPEAQARGCSNSC